jgi:hypothetical protein
VEELSSLEKGWRGGFLEELFPGYEADAMKFLRMNVMQII